MIRIVRGTVVARDNDHVIVDVGGAGGGIGVRVFVPEPTAVEAQLNRSISLHTHLVVRENELSLYGFLTEDELHIFELLLGVNRVGPKVALAALSTLTPDTIRVALANNEAAVHRPRPRHRQTNRAENCAGTAE